MYKYLVSGLIGGAAFLPCHQLKQGVLENKVMIVILLTVMELNLVFLGYQNCLKSFSISFSLSSVGSSVITRLTLTKALSVEVAASRAYYF